MNLGKMSQKNGLVYVLYFLLQMTGLDIEKDQIIEMACLITDSDLNILAEVGDTMYYNLAVECIVTLGPEVHIHSKVSSHLSVVVELGLEPKQSISQPRVFQ